MQVDTAATYVSLSVAVVSYGYDCTITVRGEGRNPLRDFRTWKILEQGFPQNDSVILERRLNVIFRGVFGTSAENKRGCREDHRKP